MITQLIDIDKTQVKILHQIIKIANSKPDINIRLFQIANLIKEEFDLDICSIYLLDESGDFLILRATNGLPNEFVNKIRVQLGKGISGEAAQQKKTKSLSDKSAGSTNSLLKLLPENFVRVQYLFKEIITLISIPILDEEVCLGVIELLSRKEFIFDSKLIEFLESTANQISGIIRNAKIVYEADQSLSELKKINEIGKALNSTSSLETLLNLIVKTSLELIPSHGCFLRLYNRETDKLEIKAFSGFDDYVKTHPSLTIGQSVAGIVAKEGIPLIVHDIKTETRVTPSSRDLPFTSVLSVPLIVKGNPIGTISLLDKIKDERFEGGAVFVLRDQNLLSTLASQAAIAVERASYDQNMQRFSKENELKLRELSILHETSNAMRSTQNLNRRLFMILTAVTIGDGLGFNRAFLLMVNERTNVLQGMMGVGPSSGDEAGRIWSEISKKKKSLTETLLEKKPMEELGVSKINEIAKSLRIQISTETDILSKTVLEKKTIQNHQCMGRCKS